MNRLLNWPKLLGLYADGFSSFFSPECVPYIIRHVSVKKVHIFFKNIAFYATFNPFYTSEQQNRLHGKHGACTICALVTPRCHQNREGDVCVYWAYNYAT